MKNLLLILIVLHAIVAHAQSKKGKWVQQDVTIDYKARINQFLYDYASVNSFICDENGEYNETKRFVMIQNNGRDTIYYRASPKGLGKYTTKNDIDFISTVSNMLQYYPVLPGRSEIVEIHGYEDARTRKMKMKLIIDFKFFLTDSTSKKNLRKTAGEKQQTTVMQPAKPATALPVVNSFYIFFTTDFSTTQKQSLLSNLQSPKTLFIISEPILHTGSLDDLLLEEKARFIRDIENQVPGKPEGLREVLLKNNYEKIAIHYGKPYSIVLLRSKEDGAEAIEAYKQSQKELLEGLTVYDFFQLQ